MRKQTDLEKEFKGFKMKSTYINSVEDCLALIKIMKNDIEKCKLITKKEIKENKIWKFEVKVRNYFLALFGEIEEDIYDEDTDILNEIILIEDEYLDFYMKVINIANEKNYKELLKLVDFANMYYDIHIDLLEKQREILCLELRGIHMIIPNNEDKRKDLEEFLSNKLNMIEDKKRSRKTYHKERAVA